MAGSRRTQIIICIFLIFTVLPTASLFADLGDFGDAVKDDQEEEADEDKEKSEDADDKELSESEAELLAALFDITIGLWLTHNLSAWYSPYPYGGESSGTSSIGHSSHLLDYSSSARPDLKQNRMSFYLSGGGYLINAD